MNHHPLAVYIAHLQVRHFSPPRPHGIERHDQDALKGSLRRIDKTRYLLLTEDLWKMKNLLRIGSLGDTPASLQHLDVKEAQRSQSLRDGVRGQLPYPKHSCLILPNVFRAKPVGWTVKVPGKVLDRGM
jgi:hypothetical protein